MRLWSKQFIHVLPRQQLVAQWRECSAIAGNILTKGTPNHILVNKIMDYPIDHFISYSALVRGEMGNRGYKTMDSVANKIISLKPDWKAIPYNELYDQWMDNIYLNICYWNLVEKYQCGGISQEEWDKIKNFINTCEYRPIILYTKN